MIVDTDVLIDVVQNDERATRAVAEPERRQVERCVSSVSLFELYHDIERRCSPDERRLAIGAVFDSKTVYPADAADMKNAGRIDGRLTTEGRVVGMGDSIVAATAIVHEEPVLTRNVEHFERIDELELETY